MSERLIQKNIEAERQHLWQEFHHSASLTASNGEVLVVDLIKLSLLSPLIGNIIKELKVPNSLKHLLDVNIILPNFQPEVLGLLVEVIEQAAGDVTENQFKELNELIDAINLEMNLTKDGDDEESQQLEIEVNSIDKDFFATGNTTGSIFSQKSKNDSSHDPTSLQKKKITPIKAPEKSDDGKGSQGVGKNSKAESSGIGFSQDAIGQSPSKHGERKRGSSVKRCPFNVECKVVDCKYQHSDRDVRLATSKFSNSQRSKSREVGEMSREVGEKVKIQGQSRKDNIVGKIKDNKTNTEKCTQKKEKVSRMLFEEGCPQDSFGETRIVKYRRKGSKEDDIRKLKAYNQMKSKSEERRDRNRKKEEILKERGSHKKEDLRMKYPLAEEKHPGCRERRGLETFFGMRIGEPSQASRSSTLSREEMERNYTYRSNEGFRDIDLRPLGREDAGRLEPGNQDRFLGDSLALKDFLGPPKPDSRDRGPSGLGLDCFQPQMNDAAFSDHHMSSSGTGWDASPDQEFYPMDMEGRRRVVEEDWLGEGAAYVSPRDRLDLRDSYPLANPPFPEPGRGLVREAQLFDDGRGLVREEQLFDDGRRMEREEQLFDDGRRMEGEERSRDFTTGVNYGF